MRSEAGVQRRGDRDLGRLRAVARRDARVLQRGQFFFQPPKALGGLAQARRRRSAPPSRSAACRRSRRNSSSIARHAGRGPWRAWLRWSSCPSSQAMRYWRPLMVTLTWSWLRLDHRANGVDRDVEALRDLAVGRFQLARARRHGVEIGGEPRAVGSERMHLRGKRALAASASRRRSTAASSASSAAASRWWRLRSRSRQSLPPHRAGRPPLRRAP